MPKNLLLFLIFLFQLPIFGQSQELPPVIEWQKSLGGSKVDKAYSVILTSDHGYLVVGLSYSNDGQVTGHHGSTDSSDAWVVKLDKSGNIEWQKSLGGTGNDKFIHAVETNNGDFICVGSTSSVDGDVSGLHIGATGVRDDMWALRINKSGTTQWSKVYGGTAADHAQVIRKGLDDGYIISGDAISNDFDVSGNQGYEDMWVIKINETGVLQWQKAIGNPNSQFTRSLNYTSDGNYILSGYQLPRGYPTSMLPYYNIAEKMAVKLDKNGNVVWQKINQFQAGNPGNSNYYQNILELPDGRLLGIGSSGMASTNDNLYWQFEFLNTSNGVVSIDSSRLLYDKHTNLSYGKSMGPESVKLLSDNTFISCITADPSNQQEAYLTRISIPPSSSRPSLVYKISYKMGPTKDCYFSGITDLNDQEFIAAGASSYNYESEGAKYGNHGNYDFLVVKFNALNKIKGTIFVDDNSNGIKDINEQGFENAIIESRKTGKLISSASNNRGEFQNSVGTGTYTTTVKLAKPYYTIIPSGKLSSFNTYKNTDSFNIALIPIPDKRDLQLSVQPLSTLRPGFNAQYKVRVLNAGTQMISDVVVKLINSGSMTFVSAVPSQTSISSDTISWNISELLPSRDTSIIVTLKADAPPNMNIGDAIELKAMVEPFSGDETPLDNKDSLRQVTRGSFDPNDKVENNNGVFPIEQVAAGGYLTYTVHFQNTGNDTAFNVLIKDTLDSKLDWNSLQLISASHPFTFSVKDDKYALWTFNDILLPDSITNEPGSHGYLSYRIKPKSNVVVGEAIKNSASIYFDFNLPVQTNIQITEVRSIVIPDPILSGVQESYCSRGGIQKVKVDNLPAAGINLVAGVKLDNIELTIAPDSTFGFNIDTLTVGSHVLTVIYSDASSSKTKTYNFIVHQAVNPDVNISSSILVVTNLSYPVTITAINVTGGGNIPLFTFASDRHITNILQAEGSDNILHIQPETLAPGINWIYVKMKTSESCYLSQTAVDSVKIERSSVTVMPNQPVINGLNASYCSVQGPLKIKVLNIPDTVAGNNVSVRLDSQFLTVAPDSTVSFNLEQLSSGIHKLEISYSNNAGSKSSSNNFTVTTAVTPDVSIISSTAIINNLTDPVTITASNISGGGINPSYIFGLGKNMQITLRGEGTDNIFQLSPIFLKAGDNVVYVRMKTAETCYTVQQDVDSIHIFVSIGKGIIDPDYPSQVIRVYPNPLSGPIKITGLNLGKTYIINISNKDGQRVYSRKIAGAGNVLLDWSGTSSGIYLLSIWDEKKKKLIGTIPLLK